MSLGNNSRRAIILFLAILAGIVLNHSRAYAAQTKTMVVAGGCFWCVESDFERVRGVVKAVSGFTGGTTKNPTYKQVKAGGTGHFEAVQITYDPDKISYETLLKLFIMSIDPTDGGGQFCDRGDSYRTAIFVSNSREKAIAEATIRYAKRTLRRSIRTQILPAARFYVAGPPHQNYYRGTKRVLTRFGIRKQSEAYQAYRKACGRDKRVQRLWGANAPFITH